MTNRRTAGGALLGVAGLLLSSLAVTAGPAQAVAPLSISATPSLVVGGQMITVKGNAGKKNAPRLYVAVCTGEPTATNCDTNIDGFGTPAAHILQVQPDPVTGAWGPFKFKVRQKVYTGDNPEGGPAFDCKAVQTCVIGTTNSANPADRTYNVTKKLTFAQGKVANTTKPKATGKFRVGKTLTATKGKWAPAPASYSFRWLRDGKPIAKATKATYKLKKADKGSKVSVRVTAKKAGWVPGEAKSAATKVKKKLS